MAHYIAKVGHLLFCFGCMVATPRQRARVTGLHVCLFSCQSGGAQSAGVVCLPGPRDAFPGLQPCRTSHRLWRRSTTAARER